MGDNIYACILYYILLLSFITRLALVHRERPFTDACELNIDEYVKLFKRSSTHKKSSFNRIYNCIISF